MRRPDIFQKCFDYTRVDDVKNMGLYPYFKPLSGQVGPVMEIDGHSVIMLGSNNYLGLTNNPVVMARAAEAIRRYGTGCTGSRFLNGTLDLHIELEEKLARFLQAPRVLTFSTGFQTNLGVIGALGQKDDVLLVDRGVHASIIDGTRMSYSRIVKYRHNDMQHLDHLLDREQSPVMIITDGVFSMEGDLANLPGVVGLAKKHGARVMVDDAHGVGVMGAHGRGTPEHFGLDGQVDLQVGTFSKSFACIGGFAAGDDKVIDFIQHEARTEIFSASLPPAAVATVMAALEILQEQPELMVQMHRAAERSRTGLRSMGFNVGNSEAPIVPIIIGDDLQTFRVWQALDQAGVFTNPVISPAVAPGGAMLRTSYMATHTDEMIDRALEVFQDVGRRFGLIS
jgi:8-amino-7-oxononanoate synthase